MCLPQREVADRQSDSPVYGLINNPHQKNFSPIKKLLLSLKNQLLEPINRLDRCGNKYRRRASTELAARIVRQSSQTYNVGGPIVLILV